MVSAHDGVKRYSIDVRLFLVTITIAMSIAFCLGVIIGPDGKLDLPGVTAPAPEPKSLLNEWQVLEEGKVAVPPALDDDGENYQPAGQHLLVDIKGVDGDFLDSEERLSKAMVDAVVAGGLTLLSYHCHKLIPSGVSCVGVLLESHISFHTWPEDGVITLDLFTCGPKPLLPVVPKLEELFGIGEDVQTQWSHELRGFRDERSHLDNDNDLAYWVLSPLDLDMKEQVFEGRSKYQHISIWDIKEVDTTPTYEKAMEYNLQPGDSRWKTNEISDPDRLLFLDGVLQSISHSEERYHEALVHPAMFAHPNPKQVAILGGGEGATLREVLKHKSLERVRMIEIDDMLVEIARTYLPKYNDCSKYEGRADNCFDDEKATLIFEDACKWFLDRYGKESKVQPDVNFDVVILDALDPEDPTEFSDNLYTDRYFLDSVMNSMTEEGVLVIQVGTAPTILDPRADMGVHARREQLIQLLEANEMVEAILVWEDGHVGFLEPHSFLIACKSSSCRSRWYSESEAVDFQVYSRILPTTTGKRALDSYDGSTHFQYMYPPKAWETVYCRREPKPFECDYIHLDFDREIHEFVMNEDGSVAANSSFFLDENDEDWETWEGSVKALVDIPKGSYIMPTHTASPLLLQKKTLDTLRNTAEAAGTGNAKVIEDLLEYIDNVGHLSNQKGSDITVVDVGGSVMIPEHNEKANVGRWMPKHPSGKRPVYSPVYERHRLSFDVFLVASRDIAKGEYLYKPEGMWED